jgi:hypothetical protein
MSESATPESQAGKAAVTVEPAAAKSRTTLRAECDCENECEHQQTHTV